MDISVELIRKRDFSRLTQFDALFIRETTAVAHHTFKFAKKAQAEGMPVIDDPGAILRCTNKAFLAELLRENDIGTPRTRLVSRRTVIGDGFYGVDLKENAAGVFVIEINDNPNLDVGAEDKVLGDEVYRRLLGHLLAKFEGRSDAGLVLPQVAESAIPIDAGDRPSAGVIALPTAWSRTSH